MKCWALTTFLEAGDSIYFIRLCTTRADLMAMVISTNQWYDTPVGVC